jgi:hypothetical protein
MATRRQRAKRKEREERTKRSAVNRLMGTAPAVERWDFRMGVRVELKPEAYWEKFQALIGDVLKP